MNEPYKRSVEEICNELNTSINGLSNIEVRKRLEENGKNELTQKKKISVFKMILKQFTDKMIIILFIASFLSFILGEMVEGVVILVIIAINTLVSIIQEKKAADAIEALKNLNAPHAFVYRDNKIQTILASDLVVGDVVYLEDGNIVPADIRLIEENELLIDESSLTGESVPVSKEANIVLEEKVPLGDTLNMAFSSTIVTYGTAKGIVVATAMNTEVGKIAGMLEESNDLETPLKKKLNKVGQVLSIVGILISILIFIIGLLYGKDVVSILMISISLAISVIPEGLPATATIVMALGVERMAKKNALIRQLPAVETLGSASVICTDKTGTLTQNKMTVTKTLFYNELINETNGEIPNDFYNASVLCNNASIANGEVGDPTEVALLNFVKDKNENLLKLQESKRLFEQPFDSKRKRMSVAYDIDGNKVLYTKGAVEELLDLCDFILKDDEIIKLTKSDKDKILEKCSELSSEALRLLGFAKKELKNVFKDGEDLEYDLIFIGISCMIDPPRKEVMNAIKTFKEAGIKTVMITGDHKLTAIAIAKELGIYNEKNEAITGVELDNITDEELTRRISNVTVFARVAPEDKLRIVNAFKRNKEVVAMTGDGVNDSPALKAADIGVAMGKSGTDVAKSASDMLLLDDNFTTIESAIREGRRVYRNIQKVIQFLLSGNIAEVLVVFISTVLNFNAPVLAVHILFVNLVTDTLPALALGVDPENNNNMKKKPVKNGSLFEKGLIFRVIFYGTLISVLSIIAFLIGSEHSYGTAVTMTFLVLCFSQIAHALNQHSSTVSIFSKNHPKNKYLYLAMLGSVMIALLVVFIPPISKFFSLVELNINEWLIVIILSIIPVVLLEIIKIFRRIKIKTNK